jgi:4-amino-4-deoxy-L-arabinose transferase-like glycosyltransferase
MAQRGHPAAYAASARRALPRTALVLFAIYLATWLLRAVFLARSFDIFYDELIYLHISENVARGLGIRYYTAPFYLHPPVFFLIEGAYLALVRPAGNMVEHVYAVRYLNIVFGGLSAVLLYSIGRRIAGAWAGALAALVFALEPFIIRINSRNLLETITMFWILVGYSILFGAVRTSASAAKQTPSGPALPPAGRAPARSPYETQPLPRITQHLGDIPKARGRQPWPGTSWARIIGAGGAFGLAMLSKEPPALIILLPLAICFLLNWSLPRRTSLLVGSVACLIYLIYPASVLAFGDRAQFVQQKLAGLFRFAGVVQESGFNQHGGPSFMQAILSNLGNFATTYILIGSGIIAIAVLLLVGEPRARLLAVWAASAYALKAFLVLFGTNEEQYFYYLVTSSILATAVAVVVLQPARFTPAMRRRWRAAGLAALALFCLWAGSIWVKTHLTPDNGYEYLFAYIERQVPPGSAIAATTNTSREFLKSEDYTIGAWGTVDDICENGAQYVVLSTLLVEKRYDAATPELYAWLTNNAQPIFSFNDPTNGDLMLYRLDTSTACAAAQ